jgi:hypothetical protein
MVILSVDKKAGLVELSLKEELLPPPPPQPFISNTINSVNQTILPCIISPKI